MINERIVTKIRINHYKIITVVIIVVVVVVVIFVSFYLLFFSFFLFSIMSLHPPFPLQQSPQSTWEYPSTKWH